MTEQSQKPFLLIAIVFSLLAGNACSLTKGKAAAEAGVARFHEQYNAEKFHDIYIEADDGFKKATSEAELVALLEAVHRKLGTIQRAQPAGWGVNATTNGTMATLGYDVDFAEGKGHETFVFHISGSKAQLYNFNINSALLITK